MTAVSARTASACVPCRAPIQSSRLVLSLCRRDCGHPGMHENEHGLRWNDWRRWRCER